MVLPELTASNRTKKIESHQHHYKTTGFAIIKRGNDVVQRQHKRRVSDHHIVLLSRIPLHVICFDSGTRIKANINGGDVGTPQPLQRFWVGHNLFRSRTTIRTTSNRIQHCCGGEVKRGDQLAELNEELVHSTRWRGIVVLMVTGAFRYYKFYKRVLPDTKNKVVATHGMHDPRNGVCDLPNVIFVPRKRDKILTSKAFLALQIL